VRLYAFCAALLAALAVPACAFADTAMQTALLSATSSAQDMAWSWVAESWPLLAFLIAGGLLVTFFAIVRGS